MRRIQTRREWLANTASVLSGAYLSGSLLGKSATAPTAPVAVARCQTYLTNELLPTMSKMFDQVGGLGRLVKGKTVGVKINLTGAPGYRLGYLPAGDTHFTNPEVLGAAVHLMGRAGARRIRILEGTFSSADPVEEFLLQVDWEPRDILSAAANVEFENTNYLGAGKKYSRLIVTHGGYIFPAFDVNHSYEDCDVFVTITKMKEHSTAGISLSMKNSFGITPCSIYGGGAGVDEPNESPKGSRQMLHTGYRAPSKCAPQEKDPDGSKQGGYRVPRVVADLVAVRPIDLAIVEGIKTITGGGGPWDAGTKPARPGLIVAGTNCVATDAVCMALMGYDPMADRGTPPFENCDNTLRLAEDAGLGTRDLKRIEVVGTPIKDAIFDFAAIRRQRQLAAPAKKQPY
jgi:uncharacterized protein (DUF362 family)